MAITDTALGPDHLNTVTILHNMALLYGQQNRYEDAAEAYEKAADAGHGSSAYNLGYQLLLGNALPRDVDLGISWLERAYELNAGGAAAYVLGNEADDGTADEESTLDR